MFNIYGDGAVATGKGAEVGPTTWNFRLSPSTVGRELATIQRTVFATHAAMEYKMR
jgi:hypothetical protein